jgi:large subunit ribosomal protein L35
LAPGVIPAYDLAIDMLKEDSMQIKAEADLLRTQIQAMEEKWMEAAAKEGEGDLEAVNKLDDELEAMRKKLRILEVQSEVNLPDVRWRVANAMRMCYFG